MTSQRITDLATGLKPYVLSWITGTGGGAGPYAPSPHDLSSAHHTGSIADTQATQFLKTDGTRQLTGNLSVGAGVTIDGVDLSELAAVTFLTIGNTATLANERAIAAGNGLTFTDGGAGSSYTLAVGAGTLMTVAADTIGLSDGSAQYQVPVTGSTPFTPAWTGLSTFAGAGLTFGSGVFAVGAGNGITVNADDVALTTPGTLTVSTTNNATGSHTHAVTSSSNPGAVASLLASSAAGYLQLVRVGIGTAPGYPLHVAGATEQFRLEYNGSNYASFTVGSDGALTLANSGGNFNLNPAGDVVFNPTGNDIMPATGYDLNIGALNRKYLTLHAAELWVETLVAQNTIATIGGRILVGPTSQLTVDLAAGSGAQGSVAYRSVATASTGATPAETVTCNIPAGVVGGDQLIAQVVVNANAPTITPPGGWALVRSDAGTGGALLFSAIYRKTATNAEPVNYDFRSSTASNFNVTIVAVSGADVNTPVDIHGGQANTSSVSCVAPSVTTTTANDLLIFFGSSVGQGTFGTVASMTERYDQHTTNGTNDCGQGGDTQALGAAGATGTRTSTLSGAAINIGQLVALRPQGPVDTLSLKHNSMNAGDVVYCEANGSVEFMQLTAGPSGAGPYTYSATRNLDGTGANAWSAGDAVFNTGQAGNGFIDLYSVSAVKGGTQYGPTIVGNVRNSATFNDWTEHWAIGNMNGLYGYGLNTYGVAVGKYSGSTSWLAADATNGIRIMRGSTQLAQWDAGGNILIGQAAASQNNVQISSGALSIRNNTTERIGMTAAGILTIKDSGGAAVFTFDASAGAEFTKPLTLGTSGGIYQGSGTFASPTTGLKIWNDSGLGRIAGYNGGTLQWYANTDGKLYAGGGNIILDSTGERIMVSTSQDQFRGIRYTYNDSGTERSIGSVHGQYSTGDSSSYLRITSYRNTGDPWSYAKITMDAYDATDTTNKWASFYLVSDPPRGFLYGDLVIAAVGSGAVGNITLPGSITYDLNLISRKNSTNYTGYIFVPLTTPLTSTSYDGNDTVTASSTTTIDTSATFGAPVGIKAALVRVSAVWTASGATRNLQVRPVGGSSAAGICRSQVANVTNDFTAIVPCNANGDFDLVAGAGENAGSVAIQIFGYWI